MTIKEMPDQVGHDKDIAPNHHRPGATSFYHQQSIV